MEPEEYRDRPPQAWINSAVDRRLADLGNTLERAHSELREQVRRADRQGALIERLDERLADLRKEVEALRRIVAEDLLTREDFKPYRNSWVAAATAIGLALLGGLLRLLGLQK